jgi:hypothetical protein
LVRYSGKEIAFFNMASFLEIEDMSELHPTSSEYVSPMARLFQMARKQGYLTYDEILAVMPHPHLTLDQLDRLFGALLAAGIPYGDAGTVGAHLRDEKRG